MRTQPQGPSICKGLETNTQKTRLVSMEIEKAKRKTVSGGQIRDSVRSHRGTRPHSDQNGTPWTLHVLGWELVLHIIATEMRS